MTFSRASNYTSLDRKQTMQTFSLQRHCGKINVFLAKGGFAAIYSTFASNHAARHGTVLQHKDPKCTPMKVHERGMISSYKICIQRVKRKKHNKPADPWNHIPFKNMKKPHFGTVLRRKKPRFALCQAKDNTKKPAIFPWCNTRATVKSTIVYYFS